MTIQLKLLSPSKALFQAYTNHNFKHFSWTYSTQQQVSCKCVCVVQPFSCSCVRDIMRKQVLTLTPNQPRKVLSSFHIIEMGILWSFFFFFFWHLFFYIRGVGKTLVKRLPSIHHCIWTCVGCKVTIRASRKEIICFIYFG